MGVADRSTEVKRSEIKKGLNMIRTPKEYVLILSPWIVGLGKLFEDTY
jgi:hypothetical protein